MMDDGGSRVVDDGGSRVVDDGGSRVHFGHCDSKHLDLFRFDTKFIRCISTNYFGMNLKHRMLIVCVETVTTVVC